MTNKAFVLLSGGLDSTTTLFKAIYDYGKLMGDSDEDIKTRIKYNMSPEGYDENSKQVKDPISWVEAVSIDYGQRHKKEMNFAKNTCEMLGIKHSILSIGALLKDKNTMLTEGNIQIPDADYSDLPHGVSPTYVPFRNGVMLSVLTAHVQKWVNEQNKVPAPAAAGIYFGAHAEDAANWAYPDCTPEFIGAMANAIYIGSYQQIRLHTPLMSLMKSEIVELGNKLGVPFEETWSCYAGGSLHCGTCPTCRSRKTAFKESGIHDPTEYAA